MTEDNCPDVPAEPNGDCEMWETPAGGWVLSFSAPLPTDWSSDG